jgi:DNA (cytosine-5)-methyltransferase 1
MREVKTMLRVADLFCGPGGMSQGLRMAGFCTIYALDKDAAAVETFQRNHPEAEAVLLDVENLDPLRLPEFDVLIGGPPCIEFSNSKGGRANILEGLRLVQAFLRVVYARKPRYWVMENVPRLVLHLPDSIPLRWIGVDRDGSLPVPVRGEFNTADFGVPQVRRRFLMGSFPLPEPTHYNPETEGLLGTAEGSKPWVTLRTILAAFPAPDRRPESGEVVDPNYGFTVPLPRLSDHFHEVLLSDEEVARIREQKTNHPYMGRMAFPDELDRPARTVVATQLGRETLVIRCLAGTKDCFRRPSVRECATLQSFPVTYQFWGSSLNVRYRLAGDAVPPLLTYAIGRALLATEKATAPATPLTEASSVELSPPVTLKRRKSRKMTFAMDRRFRRMIPGKEVRGCRVDLDNLGESPTQAVLRPRGCRNTAEWVARLYIGEGKAVMRAQVFSVEEAFWEFTGCCQDGRTDIRQRAVRFLEDTSCELAGKVPDATTLQAVWAGRWGAGMGPDQLADALAGLVNRHFPAADFADVRVPPSGRFDIVPPRGLRLRIAAGLAATAYASALINADDRWVAAEGARRYIPEEWPATGVVPLEASATVPSPGEVFKRVLRERQKVPECSRISGGASA